MGLGPIILGLSPSWGIYRAEGELAGNPYIGKIQICKSSTWKIPNPLRNGEITSSNPKIFILGIFTQHLNLIRVFFYIKLTVINGEILLHMDLFIGGKFKNPCTS